MRGHKWRMTGACVSALVLASVSAVAQPHGGTVLVLEKSTNQLDIVDPTTLQFVARVPVGEDPHEVIASADGKVAYVSNYGGERSTLHTIAVVDLVNHRALPAIDLGALHGAHGLAFAGGELYFTAETNKAIGRYDPSTGRIDWVLGTGQDRTHMVWVTRTLDRIVTSNVRSATMSIIELLAGSSGTASGQRAADQRVWEVTNVPVGKGAEGFDVSPDGKEIWTANAEDGTASIIDFATHKIIETMPISVTRANRLKFTPDGRFVLISGLGSGGTTAAPNLAVLDARSRKEVKQLQLGGGAAGILMDPDGARAFVAVSGANKMVVLDLKTLAVAGQLAPLGNPDGLAWAERR